MACERASDALVDIPNVAVSCSVGTSSLCNPANDGTQVRVIMTRSGCENFSFEPIATATSNLFCNSSGCSVTLGVWVDANQNEVQQILTRKSEIKPNESFIIFPESLPQFEFEKQDSFFVLDKNRLYFIGNLTTQ